MRTAPRRASTWLVCTLIGLLGLASALLMPVSVVADTDLAIGGAAVIAYANGDDVRLRVAPGYDAEIITLFPEGTTVDVLDGLFEADDGSLWYAVAVDGLSGYMVSDYLAADGGFAGDSATTTSDLNLRAGPSTADDVFTVMPPGAVVSVNGGSSNGFYPVTYDGTDGWAHGEYLDFSGGAPGGDTATVAEDLNLRTEPTTRSDVLAVMPAGATVTLTGETVNGFASVSYQGMAGWANVAYLGGGLDPSDDGGTVGTLFTTSDLNLRAGPSTGDDVLAVMPPGVEIEVRGDPENGFYPVRYDGQAGWAFADYLSDEADPGGPSLGGSGIAWPVSGGEWSITQGYNGSSHYNSGGGYQYHYSLDIARTDGSTAGQPVFSPVNGTVRWTEQGSGGMSIDLGNGYAVAFFHVTLDGGQNWGDSISQGEYLGYVSGPGGDGFAGFSHVHLTVWETADGGNWSRIAVPFTGQNAISGVEFPDTGSYSDWAGTVFYP